MAQDAVVYRDFLLHLCYSVFSDLRQYTSKLKRNLFFIHQRIENNNNYNNLKKIKDSKGKLIIGRS